MFQNVFETGGQAVEERRRQNPAVVFADFTPLPKKASLSFRIDPVYHLRLRDEAIRRGTTGHALAFAWLDRHLKALPLAECEKGKAEPCSSK
jgi:hypothetical protein